MDNWIGFILAIWAIGVVLWVVYDWKKKGSP